MVSTNYGNPISTQQNPIKQDSFEFSPIYLIPIIGQILLIIALINSGSSNNSLKNQIYTDATKQPVPTQAKAEVVVNQQTAPPAESSPLLNKSKGPSSTQTRSKKPQKDPKQVEDIKKAGEHISTMSRKASLSDKERSDFTTYLNGWENATLDPIYNKEMDKLKGKINRARERIAKTQPAKKPDQIQGSSTTRELRTSNSKVSNTETAKRQHTRDTAAHPVQFGGTEVSIRSGLGNIEQKERIQKYMKMAKETNEVKALRKLSNQLLEIDRKQGLGNLSPFGPVHKVINDKL